MHAKAMKEIIGADQRTKAASTHLVGPLNFKAAVFATWKPDVHAGSAQVRG